MLIVNPPENEESETEENNTRADNILDVDLLEFDELDTDELQEDDLEFTELDNIQTKIKREEETGEKLSAIERVKSIFKKKKDESTIHND